MSGIDDTRDDVGAGLLSGGVVGVGIGSLHVPFMKDEPNSRRAVEAPGTPPLWGDSSLWGEEAEGNVLRHKRLTRASWRGAKGVALETLLDAAAIGKSQRMSIVGLFLLMVPYGMEIDTSSVINGEVPEEWGVKDDMFVLWVVPYLGVIVGALLAAVMSDRWGRRSMLYAHSFTYVPAVIIAATANHATVFFWARFAMPVSLGLALPCAVALMAEILPRQHRANAVLLISALAPGVGSVLALSIGYFANLFSAVTVTTPDSVYILNENGAGWWRILLLTSLLPHLGAMFIIYSYCVESPFFLYCIQRPCEARRMLGPLTSGEENIYLDTPIMEGEDEEDDRDDFISWEEYSVWLGDFMAQGPLLFLVCSLWGVSGIAHAVFLTGASGSLMAADVEWLRGITDHGLHLTLVGCKVWAAALCFWLSARFQKMGCTSIVFLVSALLTVVPPVLAVVVACNANWQLVITMLVSVGVYVWCEIMPLLAVQLFPTSHRVTGSALGLAMSKACSIFSYYQVLHWEEESLVLPYMGLAICGLLGTLISVAAPDPPSAIHVPVKDAGLWMEWSVYKSNALKRIRYIYYDYCEQFTGLHTGMLFCAVAASSVGGFAISKVLAFLLPDMRHDLRMPRTSMSLLYSLAVVIAAMVQPGLGALVDQHGYGQGLSAIMLGFAFAVLLPVLAFFVRYDSFFNVGLAGAVLILGVALVLLLALSKSSQTASASLVNRWFTNQRGQAMSFYTIGFWAVSDLVLVQVVQACGWKISMYIAAGSGLVGSILARVFIVDSPDEVGLTPDIGAPGPANWTTVSHPIVLSPQGQYVTPPSTPPGEVSRERDFMSQLAPLSPRVRRPIAGQARSFTLKQAARTSAFRLITVFMVMYAVFGSSTALLLVDIITDRDKTVLPHGGQMPDNTYEYPDPRIADDSDSGVLPKGAFENENGIAGYSAYNIQFDVATYYYGPHLLMSVITTLVTGQLIDRGVHESWLLFASGATLAAGLACLPHVKDATSAIFCGTLRGVSYGLNDPVRYAIMGKYFGPDHLAEIIGATQKPYLLGLAAGPLIITMCRDWDGRGYTVTLNFFAFCAMAVSTAVLFLQKPTPPAYLGVGEEEEET